MAASRSPKSATEGPAPRPGRMRLWASATTAMLLLLAWALVPSPRAHANGPATRSAMPGPNAQPHDDESAVAENQLCMQCHPQIARQWTRSLHRQAHTLPSYQRALAIEPLPFCRGCHAPEANPQHDPPAALGALGVACVSCHVVKGEVLAAPASGRPSIALGEGHSVKRSAAFGQRDACANCHQFDFPDRALRGTSLAMQSTVAEHAQSAFATRSCASCHMPLVGAPGAQHRSHDFAASRDAPRLRSAVSATAVRSSAEQVIITLTPHGVGHAFPTGDLFRRIEVAAEAVGPEANVVSAATRYLARHFTTKRTAQGKSMKVLARDDRLHGTPKRIALHLDASAARFPIHWRVVYQRVAHPIDDRHAMAVIDGEVVLARGVLPPRP